MTTIHDIPGVRCFTAWESSTPKACHRCAKPWPAGTFWRWIPWLRQWVCPACAEKFAAEYDEKMAGAASRAVAVIPAVPTVAAMDAATARRATEVPMGSDGAVTFSPPGGVPAPVTTSGGGRRQRRTGVVDGRVAVQGGLW